MTDGPAPNPESDPDIVIRTRPPSPRRLSRKVLLAGALSAGALIAFALAAGLSDRPDRSPRSNSETAAAASGPPQSIAQAPSRYDAFALQPPEQGRFRNGPEEEESDMVLEPPSGAWRPRASDDGAPRSEQRPADPGEIARAAPILFERRQTDASDSSHVLDAALTPPASRFILQAGAVIPAALLTGLNSDLPGQVIAQVTQPVYDSVTGEHLLIPQGSRLIGAYESGVRYGDRRILLVWDRLILPNGYSIDLRRMPATDPSGAAGLSDRTDNHLDRLAAAIGLSAIVSVIANESEDSDEDQHRLSQSLGDAAAQQAAQSGARIVDRELAVRPSLTVRPGAAVRVLVTRDIVMRPYAS